MFKSTELWAYHKQMMKGGKVRTFEHSTHPADSAFHTCPVVRRETNRASHRRTYRGEDFKA